MNLHLNLDFFILVFSRSLFCYDDDDNDEKIINIDWILIKIKPVIVFYLYLLYFWPAPIWKKSTKNKNKLKKCMFFFSLFFQG